MVFVSVHSLLKFKNILQVTFVGVFLSFKSKSVARHEVLTVLMLTTCIFSIYLVLAMNKLPIARLSIPWPSHHIQ